MLGFVNSFSFSRPRYDGTPLTELLFLTALSTVTAHKVPRYVAPNISKLDENARSDRGESPAAENRVIPGTGSNDRLQLGQMVTTSCVSRVRWNSTSCLFFHQVFYVEFLALFPADEISATNFMEIPNINSRIATRISWHLLTWYVTASFSFFCENIYSI